MQNFKGKILDDTLFISLFLYVLIILVIVGGILITKKLGPSHQTPEKNSTYESGIVDFYGKINTSINVKYYIVAIIFVIFDIEAVFMYPWAVSLRELGVFGLWEMLIFMGILLIGLIYIYKKKILRWE